MPNDGLAGAGLLQSHEEWNARNRILADNMSRLINQHASRTGGRGVDVGCQNGQLTDAVNLRTTVSWTGIDPSLTAPRRSELGIPLAPARANALPFEDASFDVALFANVYEHVPPTERSASLREIYRVLRPGGIAVGQLPNPYFPIESHSRLPFMGWLPVRAQHVYWRISPVPWEHDFFVVTIKQLRKAAQEAGFEVVEVRNYTYPPEVVPAAVRWAARAFERPMRRLPWAWQFVLRRGVT